MTSGPSSVWPKKAYRNPVDHLVAFLDKKHGEEWAIFEFRAEGTGYPDEEVYGRVHHFPWPDHHPPPFAIMPNLMAAMRNWLHDTPKNEEFKRVAVVHCKAGKGRSGTVSCSYLISQEGWKREEALARFTSRRMRNGFGDGVSIPSQLRWVRYVDTWTNKMNKKYIERPIEIVEIHVWGLRSGVKVCVEGFVEDGRRIKNFHTFIREEKTAVDNNFSTVEETEPTAKLQSENLVSTQTDTPESSKSDISTPEKEQIQNVILRPKQPIVLETSDVNIDFERRNKSSYTGFTMVTSIAHVWFNAFFEGGYEGNESGLFEIEWEAMDGIKGSARKGIQALDRLKVVWKYSETGRSQSVDEPKMGEPVEEGKPVDWRGDHDPEKEIEAKHSDGVDSGRHGGTTLTLSEMTQEAINKLGGKDLGLRQSDPHSANVSRATSVRDSHAEHASPSNAETKPDQSLHENEHGVRSDVGDKKTVEDTAPVNPSHEHDRQDTATGKYLEIGIAKLSGILGKLRPSDPDDKKSESPK